MGGPDQLDAALGDGTGSLSFQFPSDLIDNDHFRVMVFHRFDHHFVLQRRLSDLQTACVTYGRMRHITVPADLVGGIHDDHALLCGKDPCRFPEHRRFADPRFAQDEQAFSGIDLVGDDVERPENRPADTAGQADDTVPPVADRGDPVERPLHAGAVVKVKAADLFHHGIYIFIGDFLFGNRQVSCRITCERDPSDVHHDFDQFIQIPVTVQDCGDLFRKNIDQSLDIISIIEVLFHFLQLVVPFEYAKDDHKNQSAEDQCRAGCCQDR